MEIILPLENERYDDYIKRILNSRDNIKNEDEYQEKHHIIPKSLGGTDDKDNLIYLYAEEHYYAHKLLKQENPDNGPLRIAWAMMSFSTSNGKMNRKYRISAEEYAEAKKAISQEASKRFTGCKQSAEHIEKRISKIRGRGNGMYGRCGSLSPTYGRDQSGEKGTFYGKHHTQEAKDKISQKNKGKLIRYKNGSAVAVVCINTKEVFLTIREAAEYAGIEKTGGNILKCCKGLLQTSGRHPVTNDKLKWRYATEEEKAYKIALLKKNQSENKNLSNP